MLSNTGGIEVNKENCMWVGEPDTGTETERNMYNMSPTVARTPSIKDQCGCRVIISSYTSLIRHFKVTYISHLYTSRY